MMLMLFIYKYRPTEPCIPECANRTSVSLRQCRQTQDRRQVQATDCRNGEAYMCVLYHITQASPALSVILNETIHCTHFVSV